MSLLTLAAATQKCATCERWNGARLADAERRQVEVDDAAHGACVGGPWDGSQRDPRTRCGRWIAWLKPE